MTRHRLHRIWQLSLGAGAFALGGCLADSTAQDSPSNVIVPKEWVTECAGRWLINVPTPIDLGAAAPEFVPNGNGGYYLPGMEHFGGGEMRIAASKLLETSPLLSPERFAAIDKRADAYFQIDKIRDGGPESEEALRRQETNRIALTWPASAFIWRSGQRFDFGIYLAGDKRARMIHGSLDAGASVAKARAVVETLWPRYRPRNPGEVPTDAGICTPYGFFADPKGATEQDYAFDMALRDPRYNNLRVGLRIQTRSDKDDGRVVHRQAKALKIEDEITPWGYEAQRAKEEKDKCRPQQGTASHDVFGCMFAGTRTIKSHRDVEYLTLANGQKARLLVVEYSAALTEGTEYAVTVETVGTMGSATEPRIEIKATGYGPKTDNKAMQGKSPPPIDEAVAVVRALAQSLRPRPGAIAPNAPVKDSLAGLR